MTTSAQKHKITRKASNTVRATKYHLEQSGNYRDEVDMITTKQSATSTNIVKNNRAQDNETKNLKAIQGNLRSLPLP